MSETKNFTSMTINSSYTTIGHYSILFDVSLRFEVLRKVIQQSAVILRETAI